MKNKYFISLALIIFIAGASMMGSVVAIFNILPQTFADSPLPHCTNVRKYSRWTDTYETISSPVNITADEIATYEVPDQSTSCQVVINLNGHTITEAYRSQYSYRSNIIIGKNATVAINGDGGVLTLGTPEAQPGTISYPVLPPRTDAITVDAQSILYLNNVSINSHGEILYNYGTAILTNVIAIDSDDIWNDGGVLTIESGSYNKVSTNNGGTTVINGGTFSNGVATESESNVVINDGNFTSGIIVSRESISLSSSSMIVMPTMQEADTQDITIDGGNFSNVFVNSPAIINDGNFSNASINASTVVNNGTFTNSDFGRNVTINDGNFTTSTFDNGTTIEGGTFDELPTNYTVPEDKTVITNNDGTQTVVSTESIITPTEPTNPSEDPANPGEDNIELCQEIRIYTSKDNYFTVSGIISLSADVRASVVVPDQNEPCKFVINLNGHTLTSADEDLEAIRVGSNVEAEIDGGNGTVIQAPASDPDPAGETTATPVIAVESGSTATIKDVAVETSSSGSTSISNEGNTTLDNVTSTDSNIENNGSGELNIESGSYGTISSETGNVTINNDNTTYNEESSNIPANTDPANPIDPTGPNQTEDPASSSNTEEPSSTELTTSAGLGGTSIKIPNTGVMAQENPSCGQQVTIGIIIAIEAFILAICGYVFRRLNKARRVRF